MMKRFFLYTSCWVLFWSVSSGCAVHKPAGLDDLRLPDTFVESSGSGVPVFTGISGGWWRSFNDPQLNDLVEEGLAYNPDLARAYLHLRELEAIARVAAGPGRPFLDLDGKVSRDRQRSAAGVSRTMTRQLALSAGFELDLWQRLASKSRAALFEVSASREDLKTIYLSLASQIVDLYYLAVEQRAQIVLLDSLIDSYERNLALLEFRYQEGVVAAGEVYLARQSLAAARARRSPLEAGLATAGHGLAVLLGRFPESGLAGSLALLPSVPEAYGPGLPADLLARRPDIVAASLRIKERDAQVAAAIAERFPAFNLLGSYGWSRVDLGTFFKGTFWSMSGSLSQVLLDGGRRRAEVDRNRALLEREIVGYRKTVLAAFQEVEDGLVANRTTEERLARLGEQEAAATARLASVRSGYLQGINDYLVVLAAERAVLEMKSLLLSGRRQLISDRLGLIKALGGDWMGEFVEKRLSGPAK